MTITEFLLARIAEDADRARTFLADNHEALKRAGAPWPSMALAGVERVLAECAAKRAIIEQAERSDSGWWESIYVDILAAVYADHPDYQTDWKLDANDQDA